MKVKVSEACPNLPNAIDSIIALTSFICLLGIYWPAVIKMFQRWGDGDNSYCYLVLPLFVYLCWEKRDQFKFSHFSWSILGILPAILSTVLIFIGELSSVETLLFFGLWGGVTSIIITCYGSRSKALIFPLFVLLFIVPLPPFINQQITFQLKLIASKFSAEMLRLAGLSVFLEGNILDLGIDKIEIVDACSGLRYLMSLLLMALLIGYYFARQWWRQILLLLLVIPLLILFNSIRIFATGILIVNGYHVFTQDIFHNVTALLFFLIAGFIFFFTARFLLLWKPITHAESLPLDTVDGNAESLSKYRLPIIGLCFVFLISGYLFQKLPDSSTSPARESFQSFPMNLGPWHGIKHTLPEKILNFLGADDYINAIYVNGETDNTLLLYIPFYEYQGTRHTAHAPQSCLLGVGFSLEKTVKRNILLSSGEEIPIISLVMRKDNTRLLASYFFLQRGRVITNPWLNKYYLLIDAITKKRTDGALVRFEMELTNYQALDDAYRIQNDFINRVWPLLHDYIHE